ncbi:hypothetical protein EDD16DRAFT_1522770, partial [Pisolithus croceorrhizus]
HLKRERIPIEFKGQEYFESLEYAQSKEMIALMEYSHKAASTASLPSVPGKKSVNQRVYPNAKVQAQRHLYYVHFHSCEARTLRSSLTENNVRITQRQRKYEKTCSGRRTTRHKENPYDDGTLGYYPFISLFNYARTWRPICERYSEFMQEQWDLDAQEEEEAKLKCQTAQKERRKRQTEAKKRAKEAETRQASVRAVSIPRTMQLPEDVEMAHSPAPTATPSIDYRAIMPEVSTNRNKRMVKGRPVDGYGGQYGDAEAENRSDGVPFDRP